MRIERSKRTNNVLMSLTTEEARLVELALESHMRMRGAQLADSTSIDGMDDIVSEITVSMEMSTRILEVTDGE